MIKKRFNTRKAHVLGLYLLTSLIPLCGCGSGVVIPAVSGTSANAATTLSISPSSAAVDLGSTIAFTTNLPNQTCSWISSDPSVLTLVGQNNFMGSASGTVTVSASCGSASATAPVTVNKPAPQGPIMITTGGTYTGNWVSTNPKVAAVTILTDEPVVIKNSIITSAADLILANGVSTGANLTVQNVTGTAVDPKVVGQQRGRFVVAGKVSSLSVTNCTMYGVSYGVLAGSWTMKSLVIVGNIANEMEDRTSDGNGGLLPQRPSLGHFIQIERATLPNGGDIGWNQMIDTIGSSSVEDQISLYDAAGASQANLLIHDNYLEGGSSAATNTYTGAGILTDGPGNDGGPQSAFIDIYHNQIVHTAGGGIGIAAGDHVTVSDNRIVSCGKTNGGAWFAMPYATAIAMFNYYGSKSFTNNFITKTQGGLLRPDAGGNPEAGNMVALDPALGAQNNSMDGNLFSDPCLVGGQVDYTAETAEKAYWLAKLAASNMLIGDLHH